MNGIKTTMRFREIKNHDITLILCSPGFKLYRGEYEKTSVLASIGPNIFRTGPKWVLSMDLFVERMVSREVKDQLEMFVAFLNLGAGSSTDRAPGF